MKYTKEVKAKAVAAAKTGMSLKEIQTNIGPNPKATMRYLAKEGIDYKELKVELANAGVLKPAVHLNKKARVADEKKKAKKAAAQAEVQVEEVIEE